MLLDVGFLRSSGLCGRRVFEGCGILRFREAFNAAGGGLDIDTFHAQTLQGARDAPGLRRVEPKAPRRSLRPEAGWLESDCKPLVDVDFLAYIEFFNALAQRCSRNAQKARCPHLIALDFLEGLTDELSLNGRDQLLIRMKASPLEKRLGELIDVGVEAVILTLRRDPDGCRGLRVLGMGGVAPGLVG